MPIEDISSSNDSAFVLYGRSATGKTTLASTFPKPMIYLDVRDRGTRSIADVKGIGRVTIGEFGECEDVLNWLERHRERYKSVVIDTVSQLQDLAIEELTGGEGRSGRRAGDWGSMTKRDWGDVAALLKDCIVRFRDLQDGGMNVVFIAQDRSFNFDEEVETSGVELMLPEVGPALIPSVMRVLNASVSMIGNTLIRLKRTQIVLKGGRKSYREQHQYCLRIGPNPVYTTKVRKPRGEELPQVIVDPTFEDILEIMRGG